MRQDNQRIVDRSGAEGRAKVNPHYHEPQTLRERYASLSPRKRQVIELVILGLRNKQIAAEIGTTEFMVRNYINQIHQVIGSESKLHLAMLILSCNRSA